MVHKFVVVLVIVLASVNFTLQLSTPASPYYTAGVVEFKRAGDNFLYNRDIENNIAAYLDIINSTEAEDVDIIIFPEATLNSGEVLTFVPHPSYKIAPCNDSTYNVFLQDISCYARMLRKYIVINIIEKENCTDPANCARSGINRYNTNVVFDRNGIVISRYRKYNLYYEPWNTTSTAEHGEFDTDFGVKFGHFTCFDILFYSPTVELVKSGITDFIFTSMWFSELPFLTAVQTQQSWAYSYDVNLLAAGASDPRAGSTGSGIYAGKMGAIVSVMNKQPERKIYVAKVPKKQFAGETKNLEHLLQVRKRRSTTSILDGVLLKRDMQIDEFTTEPLNTTENHQKICHENLCCHFEYQATNLTTNTTLTSYKYRAVAFDGNRIYSGIEPLGWSVCAIIACINDSLQGCGLTFGNSSSVFHGVKFEKLLIEANFTWTPNALYLPNSVDTQLMPLQVKEFQFNTVKMGNQENTDIKLLTPKDDLLTFGIYVNYFHERSLASFKTISLWMVMLCVLFNLRPPSDL